MYRYIASNSGMSVLGKVSLLRNLALQSVAIRGLRLRLNRPYQTWSREAADGCMYRRAAAARDPGCCLIEY